MIVNTQLANSKGHLQKDLWRTPSKIYTPLHEEFKFTLDPCCLPESALCDKYYTPKENGLIQSWSGEVAFCNPPYSRGNIDKWVWKKASDLRFIKGRIRFVDAPFTAPFSSVLAIY